MPPLPRVFIDTSVLFPFTLMDLLLTLSEDLLFTWVWTDELLDEWERVIVREGRRTQTSARSVTEAVRTHFGRYRIDPACYRDRMTEDLSPDPGDRAHAAAAIHGRVDTLITMDVRHLRTDAVLAAGVGVVTADEFLCGLLSRHRAGVVESVLRMVRDRRNPPVRVADLLSSIGRAGAPRFADRVLRHVGTDS